MSAVVGIIGYKNSGKTTLVRALAVELVTRGYVVAVVKHTSHHIDLPGTDTATLGEVVQQVGFVSPYGSGILWNEPQGLPELLAHLEADVVLLEGFKALRGHPKVACLRGETDDLDLLGADVICAVASGDHARGVGVQGAGVPLLDRDDVGSIADLVEQVIARRQVDARDAGS